jgi:hypothetical protein
MYFPEQPLELCYDHLHCASSSLWILVTKHMLKDYCYHSIHYWVFDCKTNPMVFTVF